MERGVNLQGEDGLLNGKFAMQAILQIEYDKW